MMPLEMTWWSVRSSFPLYSEVYARTLSNSAFASSIVLQGFMFAALTLIGYRIGELAAGEAGGQTLAFMILALCQIVQSFNMRSRRGSLFAMKNQNIYLWGAGVLALILTTLVIYVPFLANAFEFEHISAPEYFVALGLAFLIIPLVEIGKAIARAFDKKN